jgi:hypothetical protein
VIKSCEWCTKSWPASRPSARTCSPKCRALLREQEHPSTGRARREYPAEIVNQVRELYASGRTIREIADLIEPGHKVQTIVERHIQVRRAPIPRDQAGERNGAWRSDSAKYAAFHLRVQVARGKPQLCARCDTTDRDTRYEWANLTGRYEDVDDYERMCVTCHRRFDAQRRQATGRPTIPAGLLQGGSS